MAGPSVGRTLLTVAYVTAAVVAMTFLVLPIVAIFAHTSPAELVEQLGNPVVQDAFLVSIKTSAIAQALILLFGTPTAFLLASRRFPGHSLAITLVELPLVLPPAVAGIGLLAAFGRLGLLGSSLDAFGISLPFTQSAVTVAVAYVASPLYIRQAIAAFEATDPDLAAASRTLGASPVRTFFRVILPLARGGLIAGRLIIAGELERAPALQPLPLARGPMRRPRRSTGVKRGGGSGRRGGTRHEREDRGRRWSALDGYASGISIVFIIRSVSARTLRMRW